jgi:hypothetical protein
LSWNAGNAQQVYFEKAKEIAGTENRIKELVSSATSVIADVAPFQFYYCLFYFLKWKFTKSKDRNASKKQFDNHAILLRDRSISGWSEVLEKRLEELATRITEAKSKANDKRK